MGGDIVGEAKMVRKSEGAAMTDGTLFRTTKRRVKDAADPAVGAALQHLMFGVYQAAYLARFGEVPNLHPKDWKALKKLVTAYGVEMVEARLKAYLRWDDQWVTDAGHTLAVFDQQWDRLAALVRKRNGSGGGVQGCQHQPACPTAAVHSRRLVEARKTSPSAPSPTASTSSEPF